MLYLQRTKDKMLTNKQIEKLQVVGRLDSYFAGCRLCIYTTKSTSIYIFLFAEQVISWKSTKQIIVAMFIIEA